MSTGTIEDTLGFTYDGSLPTSVSWKGPVNGNVSVTYNNDFRVTSQSVNGGNTVNYTYDDDGLLTQAGALSLYHEPVNGRLTGTGLGNVTTNYNYTAYGELSSYSAKYSGSDVFSSSYVLDDIGRITQLTETVSGQTHVFDYQYDLSGRLWKVEHNDTLISEYFYDDNGNRIFYIS